MSININDLPNEVLDSILFYLEDLERFDAALVCQRWTSILSCKNFLKDICINVNKDNYAHLPELLSPTRVFGYFHFWDIKLDKNFLDFIVFNQDVIHSLSFTNCVLNLENCSAEKTKIVCSKLKSLYTRGSLEVLDLFQTLRNLEHLTIHECPLRDYHLQRLQLITANLKSINLDFLPGCYDENDEETDDEIDDETDDKTKTCEHPNDNISPNSPSVEKLSFNFLESFVTANSKTLEDLYIDEISRTEALKIASIPGLKLKKFHFCIYCEPSLVVEFCKLQMFLTSIYAVGVSFEKAHLEELVKTLPHLQGIFLEQCNCKSLSLLLGMRKLKEVTVDGYAFTECGPITIRSTQIKKFSCNCRLAVMEILPQLKQLQNLTLTHSVNDEVMWLISATLTDLKFLSICGFNFGGGNNLTDSGLTGRVFPGEESTSSRVAISNLKGLTKLDIAFCYKITEGGIIAAIRFPFLVQLDLHSCTGITQQIRPLLFEGNPCLKKCFIPYDVLKVTDFLRECIG